MGMGVGVGVGGGAEEVGEGAVLGGLEGAVHDPDEPAAAAQSVTAYAH